MSSSARRWLRRTTAFLLVVAVAGVVALAVYRGRQIKGPVPRHAAPQLNGNNHGNGDETDFYSEQFDHKETVAGEPVFRLKSQRVLGLASGWQEIEDVRLELFNEGALAAVLTCEAASFNVLTRDARLRGAVHLQLPDGGFLNTEIGHFDATAHEFVTDSEAVFSARGHIGRAGRARYSLSKNRLTLEEGALIRFATGSALRAARLHYERQRHRVVFPDGCRLEHLRSVIDAGLAVLELDDAEGRPRRIEFSRGVNLASSDGSGAFEGWANRLVAERDASDGWQVRATTDGPWVSLVLQGGQDFLYRSVKAWTVHAVVAPEGVVSVRAEGRVCLDDVPMEGALRRAEAGAVRVWFTDGEATDMELDRDVVLYSEGITGSGARARMSAASGLVMLHANPDGRQRAVLRSGRGQVSSDQLQLFQVDGRAEARGNVQGQLDNVALLGAEAGTEEVPAHFAAEVLRVLDDGTTFHLKGNARAWQGRRLLLADELQYRQVQDELSAVGHVRTTMPATQLNPEADTGQDVVVVARALDYSKQELRALYRGSVRYTDGEHMLSAAELSVLFDDADRITAIEAVGGVELVDLPTGRRMTGQHARRETETGVVHLSGSPVQLTDEKGNVVAGSSLTWDQASGRVSISGDPDSPTETIYHPEEAIQLDAPP